MERCLNDTFNNLQHVFNFILILRLFLNAGGDYCIEYLRGLGVLFQNLFNNFNLGNFYQKELQLTAQTTIILELTIFEFPAFKITYTLLHKGAFKLCTYIMCSILKINSSFLRCLLAFIILTNLTVG